MADKNPVQRNKGKYMKNKTLTASLAAAAFAGLFSTTAWAAFPEKPVKLVVPFPAGGTVDTVARILSQGLAQKLGQQIVVDYKAGAATIIGAESVAKSEPDGYTLLLGTATTFAVNPILYKKLPYNEKTSFTPLGVIGSTGLVLLANEKETASTLPQLIKNIQAKPGAYSYGSHGNGSTVHFAGEMLWSAAGVKVMHVPYKGSAPAMTDLMGGQIPLSFDAIPAATASLKSGRVKAIAVTTDSRSPMMPDVPTVAESGYPGFKMESWFAIVAPQGLSADVRQTLETAIRDTLADKATSDKLLATGFQPHFEPASRYTTLVEEDIAKLRPIAVNNHIQQN